MNKPLRSSIAIGLLGLFLIVLAYQSLDRPIVFWAASHELRQYKILDWFTHLADVLAGFVFVSYPILFIRFYYQKYAYHDRSLLALCNSTVITIFIKDQLKHIFGRYWPETWVNHNPSLLRDHVYRFNWFHTGSAYQSFPSGHTAMTVAAMTIVWIAYPRLRWFAVLIVLLMVVGQVTLYYHFLSDVIAGGLLGYLVARSTAFISKI